MEQFETNEEFIYSLIIEDLDGTISQADKALLEDWRSGDLENEKTYQDFHNIQLGLDMLYAQPASSVDSSWEALDRKITANDEVPVTRVRRMGLWYQVAAAVLVLLSVGYYFMSADKYVVISTENNAAIRHVVLPDGTDLNLNAATTIKYLKTGFNEDRRLELLKGEVFIKVTNHNNPVQFKVAVGDLEAQDIGTSFNVAKGEKQISVVVEEGKVALKHAASGHEVMLIPGNMGLYNLDNGQLVSKDNSNLNYKAWIDRKFKFREVPLQEVVTQLGAVYFSSIRIQGDQLKDRKLTAGLHYQTLDSALAVISASLQCKITREKDAYVLSDK